MSSLVSGSFTRLHNKVVAETASLAGSIELFDSQVPISQHCLEPDFSCLSTGRGHAPSPRDLKAFKDAGEDGRQTYIWIMSQRLC